MELKFKIQQYQTDAVENTVNVFQGQPWADPTQYRRDLGKKGRQASMQFDEDEDLGFRNADVALSSQELLQNIRSMQKGCQINMSDKLENEGGLGCVNLDIDMETGTGKTYVYIKTMFELNKRYGWSKFIVVVPSVAIREGVYKSFQTLESHFFQYYNKKARFFIYNSKNLQQIDSYSQDAGINVMIINSQAFARDLKEGAKNSTSLIIYSKRDEFASRRPIDVISANRPIIIEDEPQKMGGDATKSGLKKFHPLFVLNYSATHKTKHNCVYALDALDAYRQKLVKEIEVKGIKLLNLPGSTGYLYLDQIILSKNHQPTAKFELEVDTKTGLKRVYRVFEHGANLKIESGLNQYEGLVISEIDPIRKTVTFLNGVKIAAGEAIGDPSKDEIQRLQIRETIESHFQKEQELFEKGIKCLSLFFIDEVAHYKSYDEDGNEVKGRLWQVFEEEYIKALNQKLSLFTDDYQKYLQAASASEVHLGYFAIDKKGRSVNTKEGDNSDQAIDAYDLILKNKEALLDFKTKTRFIFSHSALREGWDNPNVFQICTLRHATSTTAKRQEIGRGLRICVDQNGNRQDAEALGAAVHDVNKLTVVANESYEDFVKGLQDETRQELRERPSQATQDYFTGKVVSVNGVSHRVTQEEAALIYAYLLNNDYIDEQGKVQDAYEEDKQKGGFEPVGKKLREAGLEDAIHDLMDKLVNPDISTTITDGKGTKVTDVDLNANFQKKEFQELWKQINHKYVYTVDYDTEELVKNCIQAIKQKLSVNVLRYVVTSGQQTDADKFTSGAAKSKTETSLTTSSVKYDLVGDIAKGANLTRKTVVDILNGCKDRLYMFGQNPEEFKRNIIKIIREQKSIMIVEHVEYNELTETYDSDIFTQQKPVTLDKAYKAEKHITDYICAGQLAATDEDVMFAKELDEAEQVEVYAKLPRTFSIPTPVGDYYPDWAIAFKEGSVKHIYFVAETTGYVNSMEITEIEHAKEQCAAKLFKKINTEQLCFHRVTSYHDLLEQMKSNK